MAKPESNQAGVDPFESFRRLWGPLGVPVPGLAMPTMDPAEIDQRIADLKSVETWLGMNLNMVKMAVQGLEVQKATIQTMKSNAEAAGQAASAFANLSAQAAQEAAQAAAHPMNHPMFWPWMMRQGAAASPGDSAAPQQAAEANSTKPTAAPGARNQP